MRQLLVAYDARLLETWDHTAAVITMQHNILATVHNMLATTKITPDDAIAHHPYRQSKQNTGTNVTAGNITCMRSVIEARARAKQ